MGNDLRVALRGLAARPGFALLGIFTLALGIGASAAVFSLLDALYFRPLPLRQTSELARITRPSPKTVFGLLSYPEYRELAEAVGADAEVVALGGRGVTLHRDGEARLLVVRYVSPSFFRVMGVPVGLGRGLGEGDERSDTPLVVVNHALWQERLGGEPDVVGSTVQLNDAHFTVVGVTAPGFLGLDRTVRSDVYVLAEHARFAVPGLANELADRASRWFELFARPAPGSGIEHLRAQADAVSARWAREDPEAYAGAGLRVAPFDDEHRAGVRQGAVFLGLVALVLLIASANAANLSLARCEGRRRELAVRAALGASGLRLLRQLAAESLLLSAAGTAAGLFLAWLIMGLFPLLVPPTTVTYVVDARFDQRLLAFAAVLLALTTLLVTAIPAWRHSRPDIVGALKVASVAGVERRLSTRDLIVVAQMAVSVVVLVAAGLLVRSLRTSSAIDPGFDPDKRVATFYLVPALRGYDESASQRYFEQARERVRALPGVVRASYAIRLPAQANEAGWATDFRIPGKTPPPGESAFRFRFDIVGPDYFETLGARLIRGRGFQAQDARDAAPVAVVNRTLAERMWPGENPIGRRLIMGRRNPVEREIVGVAEDGRIADLHEDPEPYVFVPFTQNPEGFALLLVETSLPPEALFGPVRAALAELDPGLAPLRVSTLAEHRSVVLFDERRDSGIGLGVGLLGLALGSVGLYGVLSLLVLRRTRELGVRLALGASRGHVLHLVVGRGLRLAAAGVGFGLLGALAVGRLVASRLHGVAATDLVSFAAAATCLMAAAGLASLLPAWRATRLDPMSAIREE